MHRKVTLAKKGQIFNQLTGLAIGLATFAIIMVVMFIIISQGETQVKQTQGIVGGKSNWTLAYNSTLKLGSAMDQVPTWTPLIVITAIGSVLIGLVAVFRNR